jgi:phospholipase/carboxylesterase
MDQIQQGISSSRIILMGFSQGGAMALHTGLRFAQPLAAIIGLSTYLPVMATVEEEAHSSNRSTPIVLMHGTQDDVVPIVWARTARTFLSAQHYSVQWFEYSMLHTVSLTQLSDIQNVFDELLPHLKMV